MTSLRGVIHTHVTCHLDTGNPIIPRYLRYLSRRVFKLSSIDTTPPLRETQGKPEFTSQKAPRRVSGSGGVV